MKAKILAGIIFLVSVMYILLWHFWGTGWTESFVSSAAREATLDVIVLEKLQNNDIQGARTALEQQLSLHIAEGGRDIKKFEYFFPAGFQKTTTDLDVICGKVAPYWKEHTELGTQLSNGAKAILNKC